MTRRTKLIGAAIAGVLLAGGGGAALAIAGGDDSEGVVTGPAADRAKAAAQAALPGGRVNAVERDSEKGATWEVEVTKADGSTVDVRLDESYNVLLIDDDNEKTDDEGADGE